MYSWDGEGYCVKAISYASLNYCLNNVDFLFHGGTTIFEEFAWFLDFSCGDMCLDFPCEGGDHTHT